MNCSEALNPEPPRRQHEKEMLLTLALQEAAHRYGVPSKVHASELCRPGLRMQQVKDLGNALCLKAVRIPMPKLNAVVWMRNEAGKMERGELPPAAFWTRYYRGTFCFSTEEKP